MNEDRIESLLRKAPRPVPPEGLLEQLQRDARLPAAPTRAVPVQPPASVLRRWMPALGFAAVALSCAVVFAVQQFNLSELRQENQILKARAEAVESATGASAGAAQADVLALELDRLRKDSQELAQLREEVARLKAQAAELAALRTENQQLAQGLARSARHAETDDEFFQRVGEPGDKADRIKCVNNLKQIGLAARIYATDNGDVLPPGDWLAITNELSTPKVLICPADRARSPAENWDSFSAAHVSYEYLNPNGSETEPQVVLARCLIHNNVCLSDGSVQQLPEGKGLVQKDGKYYIEGTEPSNASEVIRQRYGLDASGQPPATPDTLMPEQDVTARLREDGGQPPAMSEELMRRYGLIPPTSPPPAEP